MMVDHPIIHSRPASKPLNKVWGPNRGDSLHRASVGASNEIALKIVQDLSVVIDRLDPEVVSDHCMSMTDTVALLRLAVLDIVKLLNVTTHSGSIQQVQNHAEDALGSSFPKLG